VRVLSFVVVVEEDRRGRLRRLVVLGRLEGRPQGQGVAIDGIVHRNKSRPKTHRWQTQDQAQHYYRDQVQISGIASGCFGAILTDRDE
jgi:hypothetical protein